MNNMSMDTIRTKLENRIEQLRVQLEDKYLHPQRQDDIKSAIKLLVDIKLALYFDF